MRTHRKRIALALLLPLLLAACDDFERDAFRTLKLAKVEYEILQDHAARAYVRSRITTGQWDSFATLGNRFIAAHTLAADLAETYSRVKNTDDTDQRQALEQRIQKALVRLPVLLGDLRQLLASFDEQTPPAPGKPESQE